MKSNRQLSCKAFYLLLLYEANTGKLFSYHYIIYRWSKELGICELKNYKLGKDNWNSDIQQFHQYQQNCPSSQIIAYKQDYVI